MRENLARGASNTIYSMQITINSMRANYIMLAIATILQLAMVVGIGTASVQVIQPTYIDYALLDQAGPDGFTVQINLKDDNGMMGASDGNLTVKLYKLSPPSERSILCLNTTNHITVDRFIEGKNLVGGMITTFESPRIPFNPGVIVPPYYSAYSIPSSGDIVSGQIAFQPSGSNKILTYNVETIWN